MDQSVICIVVGIIALIAGFVIAKVIEKNQATSKINEAKQEAKSIVKDAEQKAESINEVKDKTDGLAMSALEFCVANESKNHIRSSVVDQSINELRELNQLVEDHI